MISILFHCSVPSSSILPRKILVESRNCWQLGSALSVMDHRFLLSSVDPNHSGIKGKYCLGEEWQSFKREESMLEEELCLPHPESGIGKSFGARAGGVKLLQCVTPRSSSLSLLLLKTLEKAHGWSYLDQQVFYHALSAEVRARSGPQYT